MSIRSGKPWQGKDTMSEELFATPRLYFELDPAEVQDLRRQHGEATVVANSAAASESERRQAFAQMQEIEQRLAMSGAGIEPSEVDRLQAAFDEAAAALAPDLVKHVSQDERDQRVAAWKAAFRALEDAKRAAGRPAGADEATQVGGATEPSTNGAAVNAFMPPKAYWEE